MSEDSKMFLNFKISDPKTLNPSPKTLKLILGLSAVLLMVSSLY